MSPSSPTSEKQSWRSEYCLRYNWQPRPNETMYWHDRCPYCNDAHWAPSSMARDCLTSLHVTSVHQSTTSAIQTERQSSRTGRTRPSFGSLAHNLVAKAAKQAELTNAWYATARAWPIEVESANEPLKTASYDAENSGKFANRLFKREKGV